MIAAFAGATPVNANMVASTTRISSPI
jgi:hypothetical protein